MVTIKIKSRDGRTYYLDKRGKVIYIISASGVRRVPYIRVSMLGGLIDCSGCYSYKYLRQLELNDIIFFN